MITNLITRFIYKIKISIMVSGKFATATSNLPVSITKQSVLLQDYEVYMISFN